jgi:hypothetical protein
MQEKVNTTLVDQIIKGLTVQPEAAKPVPEPEAKDREAKKAKLLAEATAGEISVADAQVLASVVRKITQDFGLFASYDESCLVTIIEAIGITAQLNAALKAKSEVKSALDGCISRERDGLT